MNFFKDKNGKVVVWQDPNLPLYTWFFSSSLARIVRHGDLHVFFDIIAFGSIFTWAYLEIRFGASYFRRLLGLAVLCLSVYSKLR